MFRIRGRQLGEQLRTVCNLISANVQIPVFKVTLGSFDTHVNQRNQHRNLLLELDEALTDTVAALKRIGGCGIKLRLSPTLSLADESRKMVLVAQIMAPQHRTFISAVTLEAVHGGMADLEN